MNDDAYKITVLIREGNEDRMMDAIDRVCDPFYPGYRRAFSIVRTTSATVSDDGVRTDEQMLTLEFIVREKDLRAAIGAIVENSDEEPSIDIMPDIGWKSMVCKN